jgi:hypothetical protein
MTISLLFTFSIIQLYGKKSEKSFCPYLREDNLKNYKRLNKMIAHISYSRLKYEEQNEKEWPVEKLYEEIIHAWEAFRTHLAPEQCQWFSWSKH